MSTPDVQMRSPVPKPSMMIERQNMIPEIPDTRTIVSSAKNTPAASARTEMIRRFVYMIHSTKVRLNE
jgi:hypothetical protein